MHLQAARAWHVPPTVQLGVRPDGGLWTDRDRTLSAALIVYEQSLCPGCGNPRHAAWDPRSEGEWTVERHTCQACAEKARVSKRAAGNGEYLTVHPYQDGDGAAAQVPAQQALAEAEVAAARQRSAAQTRAAQEASV